MILNDVQRPCWLMISLGIILANAILANDMYIIISYYINDDDLNDSR